MFKVQDRNKYKNKDRDKDKDRDGKNNKRRPKRDIAKYQIARDVTVDYKNMSLLQKYLNDRGKVIPRRITGVSAKSQRQLVRAIKKARFLALLTTGRVRNKENRY